MTFTQYLKLSRKEQKRHLAAVRKHAYENGVRKFLSIDSDPKTAKSNKAGKGYFTAIQYFAPHKLSGVNVCFFASPGCVASCLHTAGNPVYFDAKNKARLARTKYWREYRDNYKILLAEEIDAFVSKCYRFGLRPAIRLNGTSDITWERVFPELFTLFVGVQFYDYTKNPNRRMLPRNYDLTFSCSEDNHFSVGAILARGGRVAVVFNVTRSKALPERWKGFEVGDADKDDLRFLDTKPIAGLRAKGDARKDESGFVQKLDVVQIAM